MNLLKRYRITGAGLSIFGGMLMVLMVKIVAVSGALENLYPLDDTVAYVNMGAAPLFSKSFLCGLKPSVVPLVYKLCRNRYSCVVVVQAVISAMSWYFLAIVMYRSMCLRWAGGVAGGVVIIIGLSAPVAMWDTCLLSESVSISLMVAMVGSLVWFSHKQRLFTMSVFVGVALGWMFTRDTNAWMGALLAAGFIAAGFLWKKKLCKVAGVLLLSGFIISNGCANAGKRWTFPFLNVLSQRILVDDLRTAEFESLGMPVTCALREMKGKWAGSDGYGYYKNPSLETFRTWLYRKGKHAYMCWLLSNPATALREPLVYVDRLLASEMPHWYGTPGVKKMIPPVVSKGVFIVGYNRCFSVLMVWVLVFCTGIVIGARVWQYNRLWLLVVLMVLLAYPHIFVVWHGDVMEVPRHAMMVRLQLTLAWWIGVCLLMELVVCQKKVAGQKRRRCLKTG